MKRYFICLLTLLSFGLNIQAQTITVDDIEALSEGETVQFKLHVSGVTAMTSMHFEVELPSGFMVSGVNATTDWAAMFSREGGVVGAISSSDNALNGEGDIATVSVVTPMTAVGDYPVTINNIRINGTELGTAVDFKINVVERHTIVLDETSIVAPVAATDVNVRVLRTISANSWSTICLPFAMSAAQLKAAFGDDVELGDFKGYETTTDGDDVIGITVMFSDATTIEANHPYIIKVSNNITEFSVEEVDIAPEEEPTVAAVKRTKKQWSEMIGTYVAQTTLDATCLFLSENKFWYSAGNTKMKAFRAYFDFYDVLTEIEDTYSSRIILNFPDDETTGIRNIAPSMNNRYYDLQGRQIDMPNKGIYVKDGRKVVVK